MKNDLPPRASFRTVNTILSKHGFTPVSHHTGWNSELQKNDATSGFWRHSSGKIVYVCTDCLPIGGNTAYLRLADSEKDYRGHRNHVVSTKEELLQEALYIVAHPELETRF